MEVVESKDAGTEGQVMAILFKLDDDIIRKILAKNGFALTEEAVSAADIKWFREQIVGTIGAVNAKKFLNQDHVNYLNNLPDAIKKRAFFDDLAASYGDPNGVGRLLDNNALTEGVVKAWKETLDDVTLRKNGNFLTDFGGILQNLSKTMNHVKYRDLSIPHRKGIGGCHDLVEWNKLRHKAYTSGYTPPVGKKLTDLDVDETIIMSDVAHSVPGVRRIEYQIPVLDGKLYDNTTNRAIGYTTGSLKKDGPDNFKKTIYDPAVWTDQKLQTALKEAIKGHANKNRGKIHSEFDGFTKDGYKIHVYFRNGEVTSFFFE